MSESRELGLADIGDPHRGSDRFFQDAVRRALAPDHPLGTRVRHSEDGDKGEGFGGPRLVKAEFGYPFSFPDILWPTATASDLYAATTRIDWSSCDACR